ncbi:beta-1,4-galactosyltransferase galt-1-like [Brienomyrus brachyistius]|uniref:beta-1,4-galactosyltransferase galt-1-like n=1 Tax=Brienomyrus brachyistius TaxID=42636 RepID=UPI0020B28DE9|nr:beta-1,4-galactosyltransferase galt-1-like [Brienomyrus brachyistius]XP_048840867.1 beta-1,4-galactosyltransferase galt-1-like [Brienomyrus brachyistius]XP_048840875.1 beta-1,4-galactosyltransferase galt-1-like [Brienomyrus brachyistius]
MEKTCFTKYFFLSLILFAVMWIIHNIALGRNLTIYPHLWGNILHPTADLSNQSAKNLTEQNITPIKETKHFLVSAYKDHRINGTIRIISIFRRDDVRRLYCIIGCAQHGYFVTAAEVDIHSDHFGFPYQTTDLLCKTDPKCDATNVTISNSPYTSDIPDMIFLPIRNRERNEHNFKHNFTVCISNLFGTYNNVLQFVQTIEVYKLLGIQKVVIYNTSCGPDLDKVLQYYREEGTLEIHQWPIDQFLNPSKGWNFEEHKGDLHYYGQLTTLNDCIYRNMYRSKYLLLNDIDEIIVPYQHATLELLLEDLQRQNPTVGVFIIQNRFFPKTVFDDEGRFSFPRWKIVPGVNILEHIYREPYRKHVYNPTKMIINPRQVVQTSVHSVLKNYGDTLRVPPGVSRIVHVRVALQGNLTKEQLIVDTKLWEYQKDLLPKVDSVLNKSGIYD